MSIGLPGTVFANSSESQSNPSNYESKINAELSVKAQNESASTIRFEGENRYETAVKIAQNGWTSAKTVVLAKGSDFPDALSGAPLAYKEDAPILLTETNKLTEITKKEIKRLKAEKVIILGSGGAVSENVYNEIKTMGLTVDRIGGKNRFETAALIADHLNSNEAVIAYGRNFPDALAIAPYAARKGIPILLTAQDELPETTRNAMKGMSNAIIVGNNAVVSKKVEDSLPVATTVRYGGSDRYETAKSIITNLNFGTNIAYVATGRNFPDALAGSALAAKNNAPILLVNNSEIPKSTNSLIPNYKSFGIIGGKSVIGENITYQLSGVSNEGCKNPIHNTSLYTELYSTFETFYFGCSPEYVKSQLGEPDKIIGMETQYAYQYGNIQYTFVHFKDYGVVGIRIEGETASEYFSNFDAIEHAYNPYDVYAYYDVQRSQSSGSYELTIDDTRPYGSNYTHTYYSNKKSGSPITLIDIYYNYWNQ